MTRWIILAVIATLALSAPALAFWHGTGGGSSCTNSMNFTQACNSANIIAVF